MNTLSAICCTAWAAILVQPLLAADKPAGVPANYKLLYEQTCAEPKAIQEFAFSDAKVWKISSGEGGAALELCGASNYTTQHRSPFNIALIADKVFGDFVLELELMSTVKPYGHQDMCLFLGFEGPNRYYYAHIAVRADPNAHNIMIVKDAPRTGIAKETTTGITWGQNEWHQVRLERKASDGTIKVFFDDGVQPVMRAEDKTFGAGYVGFGSFDDQGKIRNVRIWGPSVETKPIDFFQRANRE